MTIRKAQMQAFSHYVFASFVTRMAAHLRHTCREQTGQLDEAALSQLIRAGVERASSFHIREEANLETFLEYSARYGMEFYDTPLFHGSRRVLEDSRMDETEKMNRVNEYLIFR
jgi:hypothetical protein